VWGCRGNSNCYGSDVLRYTSLKLHASTSILIFSFGFISKQKSATRIGNNFCISCILALECEGLAQWPHYMSDGLQFESWKGLKILLFLKMFTPAVDPLTHLVSGYWGSFLRIKWPGYNADHSPPSRAQVKNEWSHTCDPPICFQGVDRDNFTLYMFQLLAQVIITSLTSAFNNTNKYITHKLGPVTCLSFAVRLK
jgi:hypothetical protein